MRYYAFIFLLFCSCFCSFGYVTLTVQNNGTGNWRGDVFSIQTSAAYAGGYTSWDNDDGEGVVISGDLNSGDTITVHEGDAIGTGGYYTAIRYRAIVVGADNVTYVSTVSPDLNDGQSANLIVTIGALVTYTNYTFCVQNNATVPQQAYWNYNGSVVQTSLLQPGQSGCWTTPTLEVSPTPQNFTINYGENPIANVLTNLFGPSPDGSNVTSTLGFTPAPGGGGSGPQTGSGDSSPGGGSVSGGSVTNIGGTNIFISTTPPETMAPTNTVVYTSSGSAADNGTLQSGFNLLHQDLQNVISGESAINTSVQNGFISVTNELGDVVRYEYQLSNEEYQVVNAITNLASHLPTNSVAGVGSSNVWVQNFPTNTPDSVTLVGISNLLASGANNPTGDITSYSNAVMSNVAYGTNADYATNMATSILSTPTSFIQGLIDGIDDSPDVGGDPGHDSAWSMNFCGTMVDFDPMDMFPTAPPFSLGLWEFILCALYFLDVGKLYLKTIQIFSSSQTGGIPNIQMELFGTGGNFVGVAVAVLIPAILLAIWVLVVTFAITDFSALLGYIRGISSVFSTVASTVAGRMAMHLLFGFFPVSLAIHLLLARIVLALTISKAALLAAAASRFLFGK